MFDVWPQIVQPSQPATLPTSLQTFPPPKEKPQLREKLDGKFEMI